MVSPLFVLFSPQPRGKAIDPTDGDAEPAVGANLLTTETEDEVTIGALAEGQSYIHETDVLIACTMGCLDGGPHGNGIRMEWGIAFTTRGGIPEVGIAIAEDGNSGTNDVVVVFRDQYLAHTLLNHLAEEGVVRDIALGFEPMMTAQQLRKGLEFVKCLYGFGHCPTLLAMNNTL